MDTTKWMEGVATYYDGAFIAINVDKIDGSGTLADWISMLLVSSGPAI
ncbi:hypothetical protein [Bradyrhizobium sp. AC87j1]|nr:hypothetical protein [Bradyrhizobium sp. AC87j1]